MVLVAFPIFSIFANNGLADASPNPKPNFSGFANINSDKTRSGEASTAMVRMVYKIRLDAPKSPHVQVRIRLMRFACLKNWALVFEKKLPLMKWEDEVDISSEHF